MQCISLWQPWASLLAAGKKQVETRSWAVRHREPLLIHAAKTWNADLSSLCVREPFKDALESIGVFHDNPFMRPERLVFGAIVGRVDVVGCYSVDDISFDWKNDNNGWQDERGGRKYMVVGPRERAFGDYSPGRYAWLCANPVMFAEPIPYRGAQGLFDVPDVVVHDALMGAKA